jgi:hypothetical protein
MSKYTCEQSGNVRFFNLCRVVHDPAPPHLVSNQRSLCSTDTAGTEGQEDGHQRENEKLIPHGLMKVDES